MIAPITIPVGRFVLVRAAKENTAGGLVVPPWHVSKTQEAEVIRVGDGCREHDRARVPFAVKPGDTVIMRRNYGRIVPGPKDDTHTDMLTVEDDLLMIRNYQKPQ